MESAEIGEELKSARQALKLSFEEISKRTKIRQPYLVALEEGAYDRLPNAFCAVNFMRQYAKELKLDPAPLVQAMRAALPEEEEDLEALGEPVLGPHQRVSSSSGLPYSSFGKSHTNTVLQVVVGVALVAAVAYLWVLTDPDHSFSWPSSWTAAPEQPAAEAGTEAAAPEPEAPAAPEAELGSASASAPSSPAPVAASSRAESTMEVEVRALSEVWIRSVADRSTERTETLAAGARHSRQAESVVHLTVGDAGAIELRINGAMQENLGRPGQVRHLRITSEGWTPLESGTF